MTDSSTQVAVIGASGLVGRTLIKTLLAQSNFEKIVVILRQPMAEFDTDIRLKFHIVSDFMQLLPEDFVGYSHVFSCLGTTIAKAGSKQAFYAVDFGINAHVAECIKQSAQPTHLLLVSALGADAQSRFFYNRVKGELEEHICGLDLQRLSIFRPSLLLGERQEQRLLEQAGQHFFKFASSLLPQHFKHKPVTAEAVANAMLKAAKGQIEKSEIYDNLSIQLCAKSTLEGK